MLLWPDVSDARARQSLRQVLASVRHAAARGLRVDDTAVALDPDAVAVLTFRQLAADGTPAGLAQVPRCTRTILRSRRAVAGHVARGLGVER